MSKTLIDAINNFMISERYQKMLNDCHTKEFEKTKNLFFEIMEEISEEKGEEKAKEIEDVVISYLASLEKIGVFIGFKYSFNLFIDLANEKIDLPDGFLN